MALQIAPDGKHAFLSFVIDVTVEKRFRWSEASLFENWFKNKGGGMPKRGGIVSNDSPSD
jgi:hypothetical protein